jgi:hypothetical protein
MPLAPVSTQAVDCRRQQHFLERVGRAEVGLGGALLDGDGDAGAGQRGPRRELARLDQVIDCAVGQDRDVDRGAFFDFGLQGRRGAPGEHDLVLAGLLEFRSQSSSTVFTALELSTLISAACAGEPNARTVAASAAMRMVMRSSRGHLSGLRDGPPRDADWQGPISRRNEAAMSARRAARRSRRSAS